MAKKGKFNFNKRPISKHFKNFKIIARTRNGLKQIIKTSKKLEVVVKKIFSKKVLGMAAVSTAVGIGIASIWDYIDNNSGCFLKKPNQSICKVRELSCCQKDELTNVPYCDGNQQLVNTCDGFNADREDSCCRLCDCQNFNCLPNENMQCQRPTVADALTHFAQNMSSTVMSSVGAIFPWLPYVVYGFIGFLIIWILNLFLPRIYNLLRNKDA